jgi:transcription antitermination factor NusG
MSATLTAFEAGQHVRIIHGPLRDFGGFIAWIEETGRLAISVEGLGTGIHVIVDFEAVEIS